MATSTKKKNTKKKKKSTAFKLPKKSKQAKDNEKNKKFTKYGKETIESQAERGGFLTENQKLALKDKELWTGKKTTPKDYGALGTYNEENGGGEPMGQGSKYPQGGRGVWKNTYNEEPERDKSQPRTADGKFTYNSMNKKGLKYKSRGVTVPPSLTGGKNGVKIKDVEEQFANKSGYYWDQYNKIWYTEGDKFITPDYKTVVASNKIWMVCREYKPSIGEFKGETETFGKGKPGVKTKEEQDAIKKVAQEGGDQAVIKDNAFDKFGNKPFVKSKLPFKKKTSSIPSIFVKSTQPAQPEEPEQPKEPEDLSKVPFGKSGKYNMKQRNEALEGIKKIMGENFNEADWDDDAIEAVLEKMSANDKQ